MKIEEKEKIKALANNGYGIKAISDALGISRNTIKSFCRRNNVKVESVKKGEKISDGVFCLNCGKELIQIPGKRLKLYCCSKCKNDWWNRKHKECGGKANYKIVCNECGNTFYSYGNVNRKYCSHSCYINHRFKEANNG